jgi:hypothetical protein
MRRSIFGIILILAAVNEAEPTFQPLKKIYPSERPIVNIPLALREQNWGGGSCVWASTIPLLRWQGQNELADKVRKTYSGGEYPEDHNAKMEKLGIKYAYTTKGDVSFLEWALKTRRGAGVTVMGGAHMVDLVALDDKYACLLDNNHIENFIWVPRETFLAEWKSSYGWAVTPVYSPAAPLP